jgi:hypothetical protein
MVLSQDTNSTRRGKKRRIFIVCKGKLNWPEAGELQKSARGGLTHPCPSLREGKFFLFFKFF